MASFLQMTTAISAISTFLQQYMCLQNCEEFAALGKQFGIICLSRTKTKVILENFIEYSDTDAFLELDAQTLAEYLMSDALRCPSEKELLRKVLNWYEHDEKSRSKDVHKLLEKIRYTQDGWPCINFACKHELFRTDPNCIQILDDAEKYMQDASTRYLNQTFKNRVRFDRKTLIQIGGITYSDDVLDTETTFCDYNSYYHLDHEDWYPLGVIVSFALTSHTIFVEVNGCGILAGGYLYITEGKSGILMLMYHQHIHVAQIVTKYNHKVSDFGPLQVKS